jgi:two-component system chemotaxis sensor kinase CheA
MKKDPLHYFRQEAHELLENLGQGVLELEKEGPEPDRIARLFRYAHTLKGAARVVKQTEIAGEAHALEDLLAPLREGMEDVSREFVDRLLGQLDVLTAMTKALDAAGPGPDSPAPAAPVASPAPVVSPAPVASPANDDPLRIVRADVSDLDSLLDTLAEAGAQATAIHEVSPRAERIRHLADLLAQSLASPRAGGNSQSARAKLISIAQELGDSAAKLSRTLATGLGLLDQELRQAREAADRLRLIPARAIFPPVERTARDAARMLDRAVTFSASGPEVRLEGPVLGLLRDALVQLVKNAVAHGIEPSAERARLGKDPSGTVAVTLVRRGTRIQVTCRDDGRGLDIEALRRVAILRGRIDPSAPPPSLPDLVKLLLHGGLSTSGRTTEVAGRGVGLDIVREALRLLRGEIEVRSEPGRGSTFTMTIPVSHSAVQVLTVTAAGQVLSLPIDGIEGAFRLDPARITRVAEGESIPLDGVLIPYLSLGPLLDARAPGSARSAILVKGSGGRAAIGVERLLGISSVVMLPLPALLAAPSDLIEGASLDAGGDPLLVLDPEALVAAACRSRAPFPAPPPKLRPPILVVDDSLTTRILEQSILETAGYEVDLAVSGEEGLEKARSRSYGLFLVDIEMPGMDGFEFIAATRRDPALRATPAMLVSSRDTEEDRRRGEEAGAVGYTVKGEFDQRTFLDAIRRWVG